jgi:hypothetical protein
MQNHSLASRPKLEFLENSEQESSQETPTSQSWVQSAEQNHQQQREVEEAREKHRRVLSTFDIRKLIL